MESKNYLLILFMLSIFINGCAAWHTNTSHVADVKAIQGPIYPEFKPQKTEEGSLWSETRGISLYPDKRSKNVGDLVTVRIVEDPEAKLNADTKTSRSSGINAKLKLLGYMKALAEKNPRLAQNPGEDDLINASLGLNFDGKGSSNRNGHIKAYVSAVVVNVLPNGNFFINGKREIKVNNEIQYITISGIVRPEDISSSNEISSVYVANARIAYSGLGPISDKQKPGWLGRVIDHVWPF